MPIEFRCVQCGALLRTPDESVGHQARCPQCGLVQPVPQASSFPPPEPTPGAAETGNPYQPAAEVVWRQTPSDSREQIYYYALQRVSLPATLLMIAGVLSALMSTCGMAGISSGAGWKLLHGEVEWGTSIASLQVLLGLAASLLVVLGASKMKNLENYGWALLGAILAVLPAHGCCCLLLPVGIWAILTLNDPYVKAAFRS